MKEMVYSSNREREVLFDGEYMGYKFAIVSQATHPTAYVECKLEDCCGYDDPRLDDITVHGDFTYFGGAHWSESDPIKYLGWDYAHYGDYIGYYAGRSPDLFSYDKKWTTQEIFDEVKLVIEQMIKSL